MSTLPTAPPYPRYGHTPLGCLSAGGRGSRRSRPSLLPGPGPVPRPESNNLKHLLVGQFAGALGRDEVEQARVGHNLLLCRAEVHKVRREARWCLPCGRVRAAIGRDGRCSYSNKRKARQRPRQVFQLQQAGVGSPVGRLYDASYLPSLVAAVLALSPLCRVSTMGPPRERKLRISTVYEPPATT